MAVRFKRKSAEDWENEEVNEAKADKRFGKKSGRIMIPTSHDLTPANKDIAIQIIQGLLKVGNDILIVTKPRMDVVKDICDALFDYQDRILFRFTIGSADSDILRFWEPNATGFSERLECLKMAYAMGYETSVSCEPMLDTNPDAVVKKVQKYVSESIWLGKPNFLMTRIKQNGYSEGSETWIKAKELIESQDDQFILDLVKRFESNEKIKWKESIVKVQNEYIE